MKFTAEYNWLESYLDNDSLWLEDSLNWDDVFNLVTIDYNIFSFVTSAFFFNSHFFLDSITKLSFLDVLFLSESSVVGTSRELFDFFMWDLISSVYNLFLPAQVLFFTDYQDFIVLILHHSPELSLAILDFINIYWLNAVLSFNPSSVFDVFNDSLSSSVSEFLEYFVAFFFFFWCIVFFVGVFRILKWNNTVEIYLVRIHSYLFNVSRETRLQLEAVLKVVFFLALYVSMMIATFDDDQEELMEFFIGASFYAFLGVFVYFLYRYSMHYFSFLEATTSKGRTIGLIKQTLSDLANTLSLMLRFLVLMIRLNIYDGVDDVMDSYFIFVMDFDDDEYFSELFFSIFSVMFFDTDVNDDRSFFLEDELDLSIDFFSIYFLVWSKFSMFFFFAYDEIARVLLALYVTYIIIFEVQAVNRSYTEDTYLLDKRSRFSTLANTSSL